MISWVVDDDNSVVKYCQDNIVTIFVPGDNEDSNEDDEGCAALAIVANNTLRLRIVPYEPDHLGCLMFQQHHPNSTRFKSWLQTTNILFQVSRFGFRIPTVHSAN